MRLQLDGVTGAVGRLAGRSGLLALRKSAELAKSALGGALSFAGRWASRTVLAGVAGAGLFASSMIGIASRFEQFQVVLENTEGSAAKARRAMAWVKDFAKTTPYEVEEVMSAFVQLKAYGIDPMNGSLRSLGNASSGMSKDLMAAVEMLADAQTGEFERLKEFGVRAGVQGQRVTFTYMNAGKQIRRTAKNSAADIQKALLGIFDQRFKGMMDRQSRTLSGLWSNLMDMWANFQLSIADAGVFDFIKGKVQQLLDKVNALAANGTLKRWAEQISKFMVEAGTKLATFLKETDWKQVGETLAGVGRAMWFVARAIAFAARFVDKVATFFSRASAARVGFDPYARPSAPPIGQRPAPRNGPPIGAARSSATRSGNSGQVAVGGAVDIRIQAAPGLKASVSGSTTTNRNVPLRISRGRSMAAAS